jgi:hypothetical protein
MEPSLFPIAPVRPEDGLPGERRRPSQRVDVHEQGIVDPIELDSLADGSLDDPWVAQHGHRMPADAVEAIERPRFGRRPLRQHECAQTSADQQDNACHGLRLPSCVTVVFIQPAAP